jgi:hypothetical protein
MSIAATMSAPRVLIQILLPTVDGRGAPVPKAMLRTLAAELARRFGGVTSYLHAPAEGLWHVAGEAAERDDIVVLEVMTDHFDRDFWRALKTRLEAQLTQSEIVVRAQAIDTV